MSFGSQSHDVHRPTPDKTLYLTADGILEPLGASQVTSYVVGLSELGFGYEILSLEKLKDLSEPLRQEALRQRLVAAGIAWTYHPYVTGTATRLANTYLRFYRAARLRCKAGDVKLLHARSFLMGLVARRIAKQGGPPYIFDTRGYWVDERAESGRWFRSRVLYRTAKSLEYKVARDAAAIVTLTDLQRDDFQKLFPGKRVVTITTCVDFDRFRPGIPSPSVPEPTLRRLDGKLVVGLIGSINRSYKIRESIRLFAAIQRLHPDAHLLCLTRQPEEMRSLLSEEAISDSLFTIATAPHDEIHEWMARVHWAMLLLESSFAKRASMPTKLAEMFAAGVRPVQYGCNDEVRRLVNESATGVVLNGLSEEDLQTAAKRIVAIGQSREGLVEARERMSEHFSLANGTRKYAELLTSLGAGTPTGTMLRMAGAR